MPHILRITTGVLLLLALPRQSVAQIFNFTSGPIPLCDTSYFTANVSVQAEIVNGTGYTSGYTFDDLWINITTDHPQTLKVTLTSPQGTQLLLSAFNGAGGQNYTDTHFNGSNSIVNGTAPFTGSFKPQGGWLSSSFLWEWTQGTWTLTVIDTSCANGGTGPGGTWTPGWISGGSGGGGFAFGWYDAPPPTCFIDLGTTTVNACAGQPANLVSILMATAGLGVSYTYQVIDSYGPGGSSIPDPTAVTQPGYYSLALGIWDIVGNYHCAYALAFNVISTPGPQLGPNQSVAICDGASTDLTTLFPNNGYTETWSFGGATITPPTAVSVAGDYTLTATVGQSCPSTAAVTLSNWPAVMLGPDQALDLCGSNASLTGLYATTGLAATWTLNSAAVADPAAITQSGTYQLVATNSSGCSDTALVTVALNTPVQLGPDATQETCQGNTIDLTSSFNLSGLTAAWTLNGAAVSNPTSISAPGDYTLIATSMAGCSDTAHVAVTINPNPVLGADQNITACTGQTVDLSSLYATAPHVAVWTINGSPVVNPAAVTGAGTYTLTVTSAQGCIATATVGLGFVAGPNLGPDKAATICADSIIDLAGFFNTNGLTANWHIPTGAAVSYTNTISLPGTYYLVASNGACADTALLVLTVNPVPVLGATQHFTLCPWQRVNLAALFPTTGLATTYTWNGQPLADPDSIHLAGTYAVRATNTLGCSSEAWALITNMDCLCQADFRTDARCLQEPAQFTLLADSSVLSVQWDFGGAVANSTLRDPDVQFGAAGDVHVTVHATLSCGVITMERTLHIQDCADSCHVWFPNSFTPNNDGKNDVWTWAGGCAPKPYSLSIFDRWGELLFTTTDAYKAWDGTLNGYTLPPSVYLYQAKYQLPYQEEQKAQGTITLVR